LEALVSHGRRRTPSATETASPERAYVRISNASRSGRRPRKEDFKDLRGDKSVLSNKKIL